MQQPAKPTEKCRHSDLTRIKEREDGRVLWMCSCGRHPTTLPQVSQEQLLGIMRGIDLLRGTPRNPTGAPASVEPA